MLPQDQHKSNAMSKDFDINPFKSSWFLLVFVKSRLLKLSKISRLAHSHIHLFHQSLLKKILNLLNFDAIKPSSLLPIVLICLASVLLNLSV